MLRNLLDKITTPILLMCCVTVTAISVKQYVFPPAPRAPEIPVQPAKGRPLPPSVPKGTNNLRIGPADAPLQLVEFADFECPFCAVAANQLHDLRAKYPGAISITFRHLIIPGHPNSPLAASSAECAADQGVFEPYYYLLFKNYSQLSDRKIRDFAKTAGVAKMDEFDKCVTANQHADRIDADTVAGRLAGIGGTPSWVVGDSVYGGILATSQVEGWAKAAIAKRGTH